jgi:hypothetical protein
MERYVYPHTIENGAGEGLTFLRKVPGRRGDRTEIYASTRRNGGKQPDPFDAAFLATRYRSEFSMVEIPALVQRIVFPIQLAIGRLLGKYRRYADAPEPVRR